MGSLPVETLPIVSLKSPTLNKDLYDACKDTGFFYLTDHGIPQPTLNNVLKLARKFFLQAPEKVKQSIQRKAVEDGGDGARGYQVLNENVTQGKPDFHEAVDWYREWGDDLDHTIVPSPLPESLGAVEGLPDHKFMSGPNLWPKYPDNLERVYKDYIDECLRVGTQLVTAMGEALGQGNIFYEATRKSFWVMRMIGYPPLRQSDNENGISCGEHTDYGCVTLLLADATKGALQVKSKDGTWITADPISGAFVVNIGDMMETWTNGEWKSTLHRVIHLPNRARTESPDSDAIVFSEDEESVARSADKPNYRISVPFFFEPDFDALVEPLPECIRRTGGKALYEKRVYGKHLTGKVEEGSYAFYG